MADKQQTALVVEDNEDNMVLITTLLHNAGYATIWSATGMEAIDLTEKQKPDFILLDIQLPDIEGTEVLNRIRSMDSDIAKTPIIAVTSYAMSGDREKLLSAGCDGYIEKPIDPLHIIDQIRRVIGGP